MSDGDNVIILGAGASVDAGIPLLADFVETIWELAIRGTYNGEMIAEDDKKVFHDTMQIKYTLDQYHGRAQFDDRNLEDILSMLSFDDMRAQAGEEKKLDVFVRAITKTIELTCKLKSSNECGMQCGEVQVYAKFWQSLFKWLDTQKRFPSIITFNYDLVLERALWFLLNGNSYRPGDLSFDSIRVDYHYKYYGDAPYEITHAEREIAEEDQSFTTEYGTALVAGHGSNTLPIDILKLHGSVNFPQSESNCNSLTVPHDEPLILPPIINKMSAAESIRKIWVQAMNRLRNAKNVIIVGYSLPQTDIYMQYFLKTALGPNLNLHRIYVFDPVLFLGGQQANNMIERYQSCFSPQLQDRIIFDPPLPDPHGSRGEGYEGSYRHFVDSLNSDSGILF